MEYNSIKERYLLFLLLMITLCITYLINILEYHDIGATFFFLMLSFLVLFNINMNIKLKILLYLKLLISCIYAYYTYRNNIFSFPDTFEYFEILTKMNYIDRITLQNIISLTGTLHVGYYYLNYFVFRIFNSLFSLYLINIVMCYFSIILFYYHFYNKYNKKIVIIATFLLTMSPYLMIFTSNVLKDSMILFLSMLTLFFYDKYLGVKKLRYFVLLILTLGLLTVTRIYSGVGFALGILIDFLLYNERAKHLIRYILLCIILICIVIISPLNMYMDLGVSFLQKVNYSFDFFVNLIMSTITFVLSPLFWNMTKDITVYTPILVDSIFFLIFSPLLILLVYRLIKDKVFRRSTYLYTVPIFIHILALSIEFGKAAERQKIAVYPFIVFLYVEQFYRINIKSRKDSNLINNSLKR